MICVLQFAIVCLLHRFSNAAEAAYIEMTDLDLAHPSPKPLASSPLTGTQRKPPTYLCQSRAPGKSKTYRRERKSNNILMPPTIESVRLLRNAQVGFTGLTTSTGDIPSSAGRRPYSIRRPNDTYQNLVTPTYADCEEATTVARQYERADLFPNSDYLTPISQLPTLCYPPLPMRNVSSDTQSRRLVSCRVVNLGLLVALALAILVSICVIYILFFTTEKVSTFAPVNSTIEYQHPNLTSPVDQEFQSFLQSSFAFASRVNRQSHISRNHSLTHPFMDSMITVFWETSVGNWFDRETSIYSPQYNGMYELTAYFKAPLFVRRPIGTIPSWNLYVNETLLIFQCKGSVGENREAGDAFCTFPWFLKRGDRVSITIPYGISSEEVNEGLNGGLPFNQGVRCFFQAKLLFLLESLPTPMGMPHWKQGSGGRFEKLKPLHI